MDPTNIDDEPYTPPAKETWVGDKVKVLANDRHVTEEEAAEAAAHKRAPAEVLPEVDYDWDPGAAD